MTEQRILRRLKRLNIKLRQLPDLLNAAGAKTKKGEPYTFYVVNNYLYGEGLPDGFAEAIHNALIKYAEEKLAIANEPL